MTLLTNQSSEGEGSFGPKILAPFTWKHAPHIYYTYIYIPIKLEILHRWHRSQKWFAWYPQKWSTWSNCPTSKSQSWLAGWWHTYPSEKYEFVSWGYDIPNYWGKYKMFQTTNRLRFYPNIFLFWGYSQWLWSKLIRIFLWFTNPKWSSCTAPRKLTQL